ncbi:hypothetical protein [Lysobacter sp. A378]
MQPKSIAIITIVLFAAGCSSTGPTPDGDGSPTTPADPDGVACQDSAGAAAVHIDLEYDGNAVSTPDAVCTVDRGTEITWRAPAGSSEAFQLQFADASPSARGMPRSVDSSEQDGRQKVMITAGNASGAYEYEIQTRLGGIDPAIIIR